MKLHAARRKNGCSISAFPPSPPCGEDRDMSLVSRRHFLTGFAAAFIVPPRVSRAATDATKLEIVVDSGGWGQASTRDIRAVLYSTANEVWPYCAGEQIKPIRVYHR